MENAVKVLPERHRNHVVTQEILFMKDLIAFMKYNHLTGISVLSGEPAFYLWSQGMSSEIIPVSLTFRDKTGEAVTKSGIFRFSGRLRRSLRLTFDEKMNPVVTMPLSMRRFALEPQTLVERYGSFFTATYHKHLKLAGERDAHRRRIDALAEDFIRTRNPSDEWLLDLADRTLVEMTGYCKELYVQMGLKRPLGAITVRLQKSRWGSCSSSGNLSFNCLLAILPESCRYYLAVHEMCHLVEMNHSARFWRLVGKYCPDYAIREKTIRICSRDLFNIISELRKRQIISYDFGAGVLASSR